MSLSVNIIGAGHLGKTIGFLLARQHAAVKINAIYNTSEMSAKEAIEFIGSGVYCPSIQELPPADLNIIATPDDFIQEVCEALSKNNHLKPGSIVMHCSGSLSSEVLSSVSEKGCFVASVHPMRSFAKPELSVEQYQGTYCAIEGDERAVHLLKALFEKIGSITYEIDRTKKASYHAAGVFASNYLVTLAQQAQTCLNEAGVEREMAMQIITNLMKGSLANLERTLSPTQSLTGPIQRGDTSTIKKHMDALLNPEQKKLYSSLGKATLQLTRHSVEQQKRIAAALEFDEDCLE